MHAVQDAEGLSAAGATQPGSSSASGALHVSITEIALHNAPIRLFCRQMKTRH